MQRHDLIHYLNRYLNVSQFKDYAPNGLQVEGSPEIRKVITGVTASQALVDEAVARNADALLVHHGYFWKGEPEVLVGMKARRIKALMQAEINLLAYHLPLDAHPQVGNNVQLGQVLQLQDCRPVDEDDPTCLIWQGQLAEPMSGEQFSTHIQTCLGRTPLHCAVSDQPIQTLAWCTGGAQDFIDAAANLSVDAYLTGEVSERTIHSARELGLDFYAAGHHATERYGIKALGEHLAENFELEVEFVDIDNPA